MIKRTIAIIALAAAITVVVATPAPAIQSEGYTLFGLTTTNRIVTFNSAFPLFATSSAPVTGLSAGERLIGIDRRPKTGVMYGVGKSGTTARLYTLDTSSGAATLVATLVGAPTATAARGPAIVLSGTEFGFDFNPVADALRIVSDTGQNLRAIPSNRTPATGPALLAGDTFVDSALNVGGVTATGVTAAAYTNSEVSATAPTSTVLYDIDTRRDLLVTQSPPNAGTLNTVGSLRFDAGTVNGFDILGSSAPPSYANTAFAALSFRQTPASFLAEIDLATGRARLRSLAALPFTLRGLAA